MSSSSQSDLERLFSKPSPYIFRNLLDQLPLGEDASHPDAHITCVELWNDNLYIGTSRSEILHFVQIPGGTDNSDAEPTLILASRLDLHEHGASSGHGAGVQHILVLPVAGKACILCNDIVTFYSLPELTPAYESLKLADCAWIGGIDLNEEESEEDNTVIMICQKTRIRLVRIGQRSKPQAVQPIQLSGTVIALRRGDIACTADGRSYSLVDVVERQAIPLFEIASTGMRPQDSSSSADEDRPPTPPPKDNTTEEPASSRIDQGDTLSSDVHTAEADTLETSQHPEASPSRNSSIPPFAHEEPIGEVSSPQSALPSAAATRASQEPQSSKPSVDHSQRQIRPNILSPSPSEFLLTTGTSYREPGVGMFVNVEGDVSRPTIEFVRYPHKLALDQPRATEQGSDALRTAGDEDWVLAVVDIGGSPQPDLAFEVQSVSASDNDSQKFLVRLPSTNSRKTPQTILGATATLSSRSAILSEVVALLSIAPFRLSSKAKHNVEASLESFDARRKSEIEFIRQLSGISTNMILWGASSIWSAIRSPMVLQYDSQLNGAVLSQSSTAFIDTSAIMKISAALKTRDARTELEFVSINFLQQKVSLLMFLDLVQKTFKNIKVSHSETTRVEELLLAGDVDPRLLLQILPQLKYDTFVEASSIWVFQGLAGPFEVFKLRQSMDKLDTLSEPFKANILPLMKRYLQHWRQKKGFGSISDEGNIFRTVDLGLLHILLIQDQDGPPGEALKGSVRQELNAVVDKGVDCFDEAIEVLEHYKRLYILSRLYQSRKQSANVLATWKRILEEQGDAAGDFIDGEHAMRRYLLQIRDRSLVEQYGSWLAERNPEVGIRVFTDGNGKIKFTPEETLAVLNERAPSTVRRVLEHLVFDKNLAQYANNLIAYYLDGVLHTLSVSADSREVLRQTYVTYRALQAPKPTYAQFITDNAVQEEWWRYRSRLLQLLGGSHGAASQYDVPSMLTRIEPYQNELVPEMIILGGRQGRHAEAIKLLTHALGDYDTAIQYCIRGGSGTYSTLGPGTDRSIAFDRQEQTPLFHVLLNEFFSIHDVGERKQQVGGLLERYSGWFDVAQVLELVPDNWSIDILSGFLEGSFRAMVSERHDTAVIKGLISTLNLDVSAQVLEKVEAEGAHVSIAKDSGVEF